MLILLAGSQTSSSPEQCMLTEGQESLLQSMVAEINSTCTYNITVGPEGVVQW